MTDTTTDVPDEFAGYDDLPAVPLTSADHGPKMPRFDGDVSELPDRACWALQNLLTRRHISGERQPQLWSWVSEFADVLRVRLSELDLRLRIVDELQIAFAEQVGYDSRWGRRLLKRETINTYDAILALHLAKYMRASRDENVLVTREDIHEMFAGVSNTIDRDLAAFDKRIDRAVDKMEEMEFLRSQRDDPDTFVLEPGDHRGDDGVGDHRPAAAVRAVHLLRHRGPRNRQRDRGRHREPARPRREPPDTAEGADW